MRKKPLTSSEERRLGMLRAFMKRNDLRSWDAAELLGCARQTILNWRGRQDPVPKYVVLMIRLYDRAGMP
jgi:hypothetical protein